MKDYLIINRAKWRTGAHSIVPSYRTGKGHTALLNKEGYMCCLGFRCEQMGIPKKDLLDKSGPVDLSNDWDIPDLLNPIGTSTSFTQQAIRINDYSCYISKEREEKIKEHFATIGIKSQS